MKIDWFYLNSLAEANVTSMKGTFLKSEFNGDISNWNTNKVENTDQCFSTSEFNGDISIQANEPWRVRKWNVSKVENMEAMFKDSNFSNNIGSWDLRGKDISDIFLYTDGLENKYKNDRITFIENAKSNVIPIPTPEVDSLLDKKTQESEGKRLS